MRYLLIPFLLIFVSGLYGQTVHKIREVVIEGEAEADALKHMKEAGTSSMIVSSKDLNKLGYNTAGDVLKWLPRIVVQGPPSFYRNIMMAGLDKEFQCVLINGNRPGSGEDGRDFKLDRLPVSMIDKIEVIYNPPASLGADATIGAMNISLKKAPEKRLIGANFSLDKSSTKNRLNPEASLSYGNRWDRWSMFVNGNLKNFQRRNFATLEDTDISGTETEDLDVWIGGITGNLEYKPDSLSSIYLQSAYTLYREHLIFQSDVSRRSSGGLSARADSADDHKERILHSHTLGYKRDRENGSWKTEFIFAQQSDSKDKSRLREKSDVYESSLEDESSKNNEFILRSDYKLNSDLKGHLNVFKAGIRLSGLFRDYNRMVYTKVQDHMFWDNVEDGSYTLDEYRAGIYLADEITLKRFWISPALRFDLDEGSYATADSLSGHIQYLSLNPSLHAKFSMSNDYFLKADLARQISRPPFNSMVPVEKVKNKKSLIEKGNPDLVPSKAFTMGAGVEKYFSNKGFATLRGFYSILRDVIETRDVGIDDVYGYRVLQAVNVDSGLVWGLDLNSRYKILDIQNNDLSLGGNVSWLGSEVRDPETRKLRRLSEQPEWIVNGTLDYLNTRLGIQFSIGINHISERITPSSLEDGTVPNNLVQAPFTQWDARIKYYFNTWGGIYFNCINLFNEPIVYTQGAVKETHTMGRNFVLGLSMNL
ncbi:MAG: TonB-dependent receptor [Bacteroides sp.]|nr:TonB-dependent receptor [Bacteroides sp.]